MKTLADFKRELKVGRKVKTIYHLKVIGYSSPFPENDTTAKLHKDQQPIYGDADMGIREIAKVNSIGFSCWTERDGKKTQSYCEFPKSSEFKIEDNKAIILTPDLRGLHGNMSEHEKTAPKIKILTYEFVD